VSAVQAAQLDPASTAVWQSGAHWPGCRMMPLSSRTSAQPCPATQSVLTLHEPQVFGLPPPKSPPKAPPLRQPGVLGGHWVGEVHWTHASALEQYGVPESPLQSEFCRHCTQVLLVVHTPTCIAPPSENASVHWALVPHSTQVSLMQ
jgi:hypothetical protein